ncbi:MAG: manganese efflux pump [Kofleriaceae bacterium]
MLAALALALGLAMDAIAVAAAQGLAGRDLGRGVRLALLFGGLQSGMTALGWLGGASLGDAFAAWDHWIAFGLLSALGLKLLWDARGGDDDDALGDRPRPRAPWRLDVALAVATSIDALAAGVTLPLIAPPALALVAIGVVTAAGSGLAYAFAMRLGRRAGPALAVVGGLTLLAIGARTLASHLLAPAPPPPAATSAPPPSTPAAAEAPPPRLTPALLDAVAALTLPDADVVVRLHTDELVALAVTTRATPPVIAEVEIAGCLACPPLTLDAYQARADALRVLVLPPERRADPATTIALEATPLGGLPVIVASAPAGDLVALHHDGVRQLRVRVLGGGAAPGARALAGAITAALAPAVLGAPTWARRRARPGDDRPQPLRAGAHDLIPPSG